MSSSDSDSSSLSSISLERLNISNDQYYQPNSQFKPRLKSPVEDPDIPNYGSNTIKHALPAYDLWRPFFPTYLSQEKFRNFHRPKLRHFNTGPRARTKYRKIKPQPVKSLSRSIYVFQKKLRNRVIDAINRGSTKEEITNKFLLIKRARDLTAKEGELVLFEYVEEQPPILSQTGMASNVKIIKQPSQCPVTNTAKNKLNQQISGDAGNNFPTNPDDQPRNLHNSACSFGFEQVLSKNVRSLPNNTRTKQQMYYNELKPGSTLQVIENNLYRAPIYQHELPSTDFLIVRTRNNLYIRSIQTIFTVGQTMPLVAVPKPEDAAMKRFYTDLSNIYISKLFMQSDTDPPSIDPKTVLKLFPNYDWQTLRRRLYKRGAKLTIYGDEKVFYEGTSTYGKLPLRELRNSLTPERYCLNMAALAAKHRLMELNYTDSMILPDEDADIETEVLAAPWHTTKAIMDTAAGRCYLDLKKHLIDPTGMQREGFSCVAWAKSQTEVEQLKERAAKTKLNQKPSTGALPFTIEKNPMQQKIMREKLERLATYNREAQLISEIQANVLNSREELSSDENDSDGAVEADEENVLDSSFDTQLKDLDNLVIGNKSSSQLNFEKEEEERRKLLKEFGTNTTSQENKQPPPRDNEESHAISAASLKGKVLIINRTYDTPDGRYQRTEFVREPKIIALYLKKKETSLNINQTTYDNSHVKYAGDSSSVKIKEQSQNGRRSSLTLGPSELCRAEGTVITISKKVLDTRTMRNLRRKSKNESSS